MRRYTTEESREIAATIRQQLGAQFAIMTGAKNFGFGDGSLSFTIGRNSKKVTNVSIVLEDNDTYTMIFSNVNMRKCEVKTIAEVKNVYCDMLKPVFEENTELYTSL